MKEQHKTTEKGLHETEISNLPDKEFKVMVIKILIELEKIVKDLSETVTKR